MIEFLKKIIEIKVRMIIIELSHIMIKEKCNAKI
jgi:hypothetical protein